jgi:hypothetical protein
MAAKLAEIVQYLLFALLDKKKWKPEIKDSWMTFFSSIVKVMKKNEMKVYGLQSLDYRVILSLFPLKKTQRKK